ncbi:MAG: helix-turn-helix transcriptional regulator [Anaerorhabdus sp.]|uniref:helix-turn-helix transcriptional regulator n=2 Tax=Anaerorhabdus sp. TaxID=1872524 RepID=UPI002FCC0594
MEFKIESYTGNILNKTKNHLYIEPCKELKHVVAHYTITFQNSENPISEGSVLNLIPDVSGCFVFRFLDEFIVSVWGPTTKVVTVKNDLNLVGSKFFVEFLPGGLYQVLGVDISKTVDKKYELQDFNQELFDEINNRIQSMDSFDEIIKMVNKLLTREVKKNKIEKSIGIWIENIARENLNVSAKDIADSLGFSERQITRYFNRYVGLGVKKYSKIVHLNKAIEEFNSIKFTQIANNHEYFDQAHFNHVFKEICGKSPSHYLENMSDFYNEIYKF